MAVSPRWCLTFFLTAAVRSARTTSWCAIAGYPSWTKKVEVFSSLTAPVDIIRSPMRTSGLRAPELPILISTGLLHMRDISTSAISVLSGPMPVDITEIPRPRHLPVCVTNSLCFLVRRPSSKSPATRSALAGSPQSRMLSASSPGASAMWYCFSTSPPVAEGAGPGVMRASIVPPSPAPAPRAREPPPGAPFLPPFSRPGMRAQPRSCKRPHA
ncbi:MAG: hypothetical protein QW379_01840 [Thermoplasmata archaeon]